MVEIRKRKGVIRFDGSKFNKTKLQVVMVAEYLRLNSLHATQRELAYISGVSICYMQRRAAALEKWGFLRTIFLQVRQTGRRAVLGYTQGSYGRFWLDSVRRHKPQAIEEVGARIDWERVKFWIIARKREGRK